MEKNNFDPLRKEYRFLRDLPYCECGTGWLDLIKELCQALSAMNPGQDFKVVQIKEKFGGLRFYVEGVAEGKLDEVYELIKKAERKSFEICEDCGKPGTVCARGWLIRTLCENCRKNSN